MQAGVRRAAGFAGCLPRALDRGFVLVEPDDGAVREGLRHDDRRSAVAAADVGDFRPRLEPLDDAVQGRQPFLDQKRAVTGAEELLDAAEQACRMLVPADALARPERLGDLRLVHVDGRGARSEERRVGEEWFSTFSYRGVPTHLKKK